MSDGMLLFLLFAPIGALALACVAALVERVR